MRKIFLIFNFPFRQFDRDLIFQITHFPKCSFFFQCDIAALCWILYSVSVRLCICTFAHIINSSILQLTHKFEIYWYFLINNCRISLGKSMIYRIKIRNFIVEIWLHEVLTPFRRAPFLFNLYIGLWRSKKKKTHLGQIKCTFVTFNVGETLLNWKFTSMNSHEDIK